MAWLGTISNVGLFRSNAKLVFFGLDNAGKSTLLSQLLCNRVTANEPTKHAHKEELSIGRVHFLAFDLGGHVQARRTWREYYLDADAIVFIVDVADHQRMAEAASELEQLLNADELRNTAFLVLGNKIDLRTACSEQQCRECFRLKGITTGKTATRKTLPPGTRPVELFMCSILLKQGFNEGFKWLVDNIEN